LTVQIISNINPPGNITNLFGNWMNGVHKKEKAHTRVGVCALLWAIWGMQNDFIASFPSFM
jgi:hypothetical protein